MLKRLLLHVSFALAAGAVAAAALWPGWFAGRAIDARAAAFAYGQRRAPNPNYNILLVEIDDASLDLVGPWPWRDGDIQKLFESPFESAALVVSAVAPEDFAFDAKSAGAWWKFLRAFDATVPLEPYAPLPPPVDVAPALSVHPAGGQGEALSAGGLSHETMVRNIPEWRAQVIRGVAFRYLRQYPDATLDDFSARALGPYWYASEPARRLAAFWFDQARIGDAVAARSALSGFEPGRFTALPEIDAVCVPPLENLDGRPAGVIGPSPNSKAPYESAFMVAGKLPVARLGIAALGAARGFKPPRFDGRAIVIDLPHRRTWRLALTEDGSFLPDWPGNAHTPWDAGFRTLPLATLVEAANAQRALWEGFHLYEAAFGENQIPPLVEDYERAVAAADLPARTKALNRITSRVTALRQSLWGDNGRRGPARTPAEDAARSRFSTDIVTLDFDYQLLANFIAESIADRVVVVAPSAARFRSMRAPWGAEVPPAALEVSLLNAIMNGRTMTSAPWWLWWLTAVIGTGLIALLASRVRFALALPAAVVLIGLAGLGWFALFDRYNLLLGFSSIAALPVGCVAGVCLREATLGRRLRAVRRMLSGRLAPRVSRAVIKGFGRTVLRRVAGASVLTVRFDFTDPAPSPETVRRYTKGVTDVIFSQSGVALDSLGNLEGAFGWLDASDAVEAAVTAALSAQKRLRLLAEKLAAERAGAIELRMGVAGGPGSLAPGKITAAILTGSGEAFRIARAAADEAARTGARIVISKADVERARANHELRRLDPSGRFYEVLERSGALSVTMRQVRELYEKALDDLAAGRPDAARALLERALALTDDAPSRSLLADLNHA